MEVLRTPDERFNGLKEYPFEPHYTNIKTHDGTILRIHGKPLTKYGQPCDIAAFPFEYDRMYFNAFVYEGPATTADFIVADACNIVASASVVQNSSYPSGLSAEWKQAEINYYSYQAGYLKSLYRMGGYNEKFKSQDGVDLWIRLIQKYKVILVRITSLVIQIFP